MTLDFKRTSVSGDVVNISGVTVTASVNISGQIVQISGQSVSANVSGQTVNSNVSGNVVVTSISGNAVIFSGQGVWVSGSLSTSVSGNVVGISGEVVVAQSGLTVRITNHVGTSGIIGTTLSADTASVQSVGLYTGAFTHGHDPVSNTWVRLKITASGATAVSGIPNKLVVDFSGAVATVSGNTIATSVSGNVIRTIPDSSTTIRTAQGQVCTDASGGTALPSLAADRLIIRMNPDHSGRMFVGSTTNPPVSGLGFILKPGDGITLQTSNANNIRVFATLSGESIYMISEDT